MDAKHHELNPEFDRLYDEFVKPVEAQHLGEFVAVSPDGRMIFSRKLYDVVRRATAELGPGTYGFRVGERVVGNIL